MNAMICSGDEIYRLYYISSFDVTNYKKVYWFLAINRTSIL